MLVPGELVASVIRDDIRAMTPYAVQNATGLVKLDAMESPYSLPDDLRGELGQRLAALAINRYPEPRADALRDTIKRVMRVPDRCAVLLGNGSDELIGLICMATAREGAAILSPSPGFVMFGLAALLARVRFIDVPLAVDFTLRRDATLAAIAEHRPTVVFIAYPNNPTGNLFARSDVKAVIAATREVGGLVVVDEAYHAFASDSFMPDLLQHDTLVVLRTVSKGGLAGARLGYLSGSPSWLAEFDKVRPPYNVNVFTQCAVQFALEHGDVLDAQAAVLRAERAKLFDALRSVARVTPFPSDANFILFRIDHDDPDAATLVFANMKRRGVLIKNLSRHSPLCANCLRVTVSTAVENALFLDALAFSLKECLHS